jgi:hypothetical protein
VRLHDLKNILQRRRLETVRGQIESGQPTAVEDFAALELHSVPTDKREMVARAFYMQAKAMQLCLLYYPKGGRDDEFEAPATRRPPPPTPLGMPGQAGRRSEVIAITVPK